MRGSRSKQQAERFAERYAVADTDALLAVEREAIGGNVGANGYTTVAQADRLLEVLELASGSRLLDVGAGRGWPGLYLAAKSGCEAAITDVPLPGVRAGLERAEREGIAARCRFALASGEALPFRAAAFDAVVHTDTL